MASFDLKITLSVKSDRGYLYFDNIEDMLRLLDNIIEVIPSDKPIKYKAKLENLMNGIIIDQSN